MVNYENYRLKWDNAGDILPDIPLHLDVEITSQCNLKCYYCPQSIKEKGFAIDNMNFELFKKIIDNAVKIGVCGIKLNLRGEATMYPQFIDACQYIKGKFIDARINTNGQFGNFLLPIVADTFNFISLSWHGIDLTNLILDFNKIGIKPDVSFVNTKDNATKQAIEYYRTLDCVVKVRNVVARTDNVIVPISMPYLQRKNCIMPNRRLTIGYNGKVYGCCVCTWNENTAYLLGNIRTQSLLDIWQGSKANALRQMLADGSAFNELEQCKNCLSWESFQCQK